MSPWEGQDERPRAADLLLILIGAAVTVIYVGYYYGTGAHNDYLPWIYHLADPDLLSRDWISSSPAYHYNMLWFLARTSKVISLPLAFLIIHCLTAFLLVGSLFLLSRGLFGSRVVFFLTLFLLLHWGLDSSGTTAVGGNALFSFQFAPHVVAVPFCILAFHFFIGERYVWAGALAGLATNIHFLLGGITMLIIGTYLIGRGRVVGWRSAAGSFLSYGLVAALTLAPVLREQLTMDTVALPPHTFTELMGRMRSPHHYLPTTWPWPPYARFLTLLLFALATFHYRPETGRHRRTLFIGGSILGLCVIGTVFVEFIPVDLITKLQFFRMLIFVKLFATMYVANFLRVALEKGDPRQRALALLLLAIDHYAWVGLVGGCLLAYGLKKSSGHRGAFWAATALGLGSIIFLIAGQRPDTWRMEGAGLLRMVLMGAGGLAVLWGAYYYGDHHPTRRTGPLLTLLLVAILAKDTAWAWRQDGLAYYFRYELKATSPWEHMALWIGNHTPRDARCATPPYLGGFRVYAQRAIIADFATPPLWDRDLPEWKRRLEELCGGAPLNCSFDSCRAPMQAGYAGMTGPAIRALADKYGAEYFVCETRDDLPFERVYRNEEFDVYRVK